MLSSWTGRFYPYALMLLRVTTGFMFWQHGLQKFGYLEGRLREFPELLWFAGILELVGGVIIALGIFTRPVAFLLSGEMAVAYFMAHAPRGFWPIVNTGERAYLFCFIFLFLAAAGPGAFSLDGWLSRYRGKHWWM